MAPHPVPQRGLPSDYGEVLSRLKEQTRSAQLRAHRAVKTELIKLYWFIGKTILGRQEAEGWGAGAGTRSKSQGVENELVVAKRVDAGQCSGDPRGVQRVG